MKFIRRHFLSKVVAIVAGLAFLNMSFFLAEVSMLDFGKTNLIENIVKLIQSTGFEEERETETSGESSVKEILAARQVQIFGTSSYLISTRVNGALVDHYLHANHAFKFSPPPDIHCS